MKRRTWLLLGACAALACGALAWLSITTLGLERAEAEARESAAIEERVRLALWRMDGRMARLVAEESTRGPEQWESFYVPAHAYDLHGDAATESMTRIASPVLLGTSDGVKLHFTLGRAGTIVCAEAPRESVQRRLALRSGVDDEQLGQRDAACDAFAALVDRAKLDAFDADGPRTSQQIVALAQTQVRVSSPQPAESEPRVMQPPQQAAPNAANAALTPPHSQKAGQAQEDDGAAQVAQPDLYAQAQVAQSNLPPQQSAFEFTKRQEQFLNNAMPPVAQQKTRKVVRAVASDVAVGAMRPLWMNGELLLVRRVDSTERGSTVQGVWLDWRRVQSMLTTEVADLLPAASLERVDVSAPGLVERQLASIPARLVPGAVPQLPRAPSTVPWILGAAWGAMLLSLVALAILLFGAVSLSERRAAFVSAVTHELRTPLTTFRMYAEMLSSGMVTDDGQRASYYETLEKESNRLAHLVENVLAYARLEKKRAPKAVEAMPLGTFVRDNLKRSEDRAREAGMTLVVELSESASATPVRVEPAAAEQILFNLVDNACKYARDASDRRIHVDADPRGGRLAVRVRDHGAGVSARDAKHLFEPFSKSSERAAESAPGVGLGLALSRRLARAMGGELRYEGGPTGACFALVLKTAEPRRASD